ncbi:MAG: AMMECR1 domain-containing protein [Candidatus Sericytochromatia bacterium]
MARTLLVGLLLLSALALPAQAADLARYQKPEVERAIATLTREAILAHVSGRPYAPSALPEALRQPGGVFVTISQDGVTRGCWGTVHPQEASLAREITVSAVKALSHDYRQRPIHPRELPQLVAHVSIIGPLVPLNAIQTLQPRRHGLLVTAPGKGGLLLPGEALTASWALATCRKKAGLKAHERASMYRFDTAVVGPVSLHPEE